MADYSQYYFFSSSMSQWGMKEVMCQHIIRLSKIVLHIILQALSHVVCGAKRPNTTLFIYYYQAEPDLCSTNDCFQISLVILIRVGVVLI